MSATTKNVGENAGLDDNARIEKWGWTNFTKGLRRMYLKRKVLLTSQLCGTSNSSTLLCPICELHNSSNCVERLKRLSSFSPHTSARAILEFATWVRWGALWSKIELWRKMSVAPGGTNKCSSSDESNIKHPERNYLYSLKHHTPFLTRNNICFIFYFFTH